MAGYGINQISQIKLLKPKDHIPYCRYENPKQIERDQGDSPQDSSSAVFSFSPKSLKEKQCPTIDFIRPTTTDEGKYECRSEHVRIKDLEICEDQIMHREEDIVNVMKHVQDVAKSKSKIVSLTGVRGVGKSSVAKEVLKHLKARRFFTGGIMMINLNDVNSTDEMLRQIDERIQLQFKIQIDEKLIYDMTRQNTHEIKKLIIQFI